MGGVQLQLSAPAVATSRTKTATPTPPETRIRVLFSVFLLQSIMALHMAGHTRSLRPQQVGPCRPLSLNRRRSLVATPAVLAPQPSVATVEASGGYETAVSGMRTVFAVNNGTGALDLKGVCV